MGIMIVEGRSPEIQAAAKGFEVSHLANPDHRQIGMAFARLAQEMILRIRTNDAALAVNLKELQQSRDAFIRVLDHHAPPREEG